MYLNEVVIVAGAAFVVGAYALYRVRRNRRIQDQQRLLGTRNGCWKWQESPQAWTGAEQQQAVARLRAVSSAPAPAAARSSPDDSFTTNYALTSAMLHSAPSTSGVRTCANDSSYSPDSGSSSDSGGSCSSD